MFALLWEGVFFQNAMKKQNTVFTFNFSLFTLSLCAGACPVGCAVCYPIGAPLPPVNLGSIYLSNQFNLGNLWLKLNLSAVALAKADQSKHINYAKQSQFPKKSNVYNLNENNEL
jgi:hypothetical protein